MPDSYASMLIELRRRLAPRDLGSESDAGIYQIRQVSDKLLLTPSDPVASILGPTYYAYPTWSVASLLSWWTLAAMETGRDIVGPYDGTLAGNAAFASAVDLTLGRTRRYVTFDGAGDEINVGNIVDLNGAANVTWAARFQLNALVHDSIIISRIASGNWQFYIVIDVEGSISVTIAYPTVGGAVKYTPVSLVTTGSWYSLVVVYDGSQGTPNDRVKIYLNGVEVSTGAVGTIPTTLRTGTINALIGNSYLSSTTTNGNIYDVAIWLASLTPAQVLAFHNDSVSDRLLADFSKAS